MEITRGALLSAFSRRSRCQPSPRSLALRQATHSRSRARCSGLSGSAGTSRNDRMALGRHSRRRLSGCLCVERIEYYDNTVIKTKVIASVQKRPLSPMGIPGTVPGTPKSGTPPHSGRKRKNRGYEVAMRQGYSHMSTFSTPRSRRTLSTVALVALNGFITTSPPRYSLYADGHSGASSMGENTMKNARWPLNPG